MKKNISLTITMPLDKAASVVGRLYGAGVLSKEKYIKYMKKIDNTKLLKDELKNQKLKKIFNNPKSFYENYKKTLLKNNKAVQHKL